MVEQHKAIYIYSVPYFSVLSVDYNNLYSTITTLHKGHDYRLRPTVSRIRDSSENEEIYIMQWMRGKCNIADALTKQDLAAYKLLNKKLVLKSIPDVDTSKTKRVNFTSQEPSSGKE